jgi:hypothetical protein
MVESIILESVVSSVALSELQATTDNDTAKAKKLNLKRFFI